MPLSVAVRPLARLASKSLLLRAVENNAGMRREGWLVVSFPPVPPGKHSALTAPQQGLMFYRQQFNPPEIRVKYRRSRIRTNGYSLRSSGAVMA
jgi:hypothetical protein